MFVKNNVLLWVSKNVNGAVKSDVIKFNKGQEVKEKDDHYKELKKEWHLVNVSPLQVTHKDLEAKNKELEALESKITDLEAKNKELLEDNKALSKEIKELSKNAN